MTETTDAPVTEAELAEWEREFEPVKISRWMPASQLEHLALQAAPRLIRGLRDARQERDEAREANRTLREAMKAWGVRGYEHRLCHVGVDCDECDALRAILASPDPAAGKVLVDAKRLEALEFCAEIAGAVYESSIVPMNAGALSHALCDLGDALAALDAAEAGP